MDVIKMEREISEIIERDNRCNVEFEWSYNNDLNDCIVSLHILTFNPIHGTKFLMYKDQRRIDRYIMVEDRVKIEMLGKGLDYIRNQESDYLNYMVEWNYKNGDKTKISYFRGKSLEDIMEKFYYGKSMHSIVVYKMEMISES